MLCRQRRYDFAGSNNVSEHVRETKFFAGIYYFWTALDIFKPFLIRDSLCAPENILGKPLLLTPVMHKTQNFEKR